VPRSFTGKLLVATPKLEDPNFYRTVILIVAHDAEGAFGVVLNRPLDAQLSEHMPDWASLAAPPGVVFLGGPVEKVRALGLGRRRWAPPCPGWTPLNDEVGLVDLTIEPWRLGTPLDEVRVFTGYAGWTAGQLDAEVAEDAWFVVEALAGDAFTRNPESLWQEVVRRQHGKIAMYAHYPADPSVN